MPLYLDSDYLNSIFSTPVANAMHEIKTSMEKEGVTPSYALSLIKDYLLPLLTEHQRSVVDSIKHCTWDDIFFIYVELGFECKNGGIVSEVTNAIYLIYQHTLSTPREFTFRNTVDVTHFLDTCRFLKIGVGDLRHCDEDSRFDLFGFCKYCWRLSAPGRQLCLAHSSGNKHLNQNIFYNEAKKEFDQFSNYKEGSRQKTLFDKTLNRLLTAESIEFHESSFRERIIPPPIGLIEWFRNRRPHLFKALSLENCEMSDRDLIDMLLNTLHGTDSLPFSIGKFYERANNRISENVFLFGPMLARAESWLVARSEFRERWGGKRNNSGRKKSNL